MVDMFLLFLLLLLLLLFYFCLVNGCVMLCRASVVGAVVVVCWICHIVYTLFSLSLSLPFLCSLFPHLCFFFCTFISHSFDLQRASSVRRDVCAMRMRCAFKIRFFIRQNICLRTYLCGECLARVLIAIRHATSIIAAVFPRIISDICLYTYTQIKAT